MSAPAPARTTRRGVRGGRPQVLIVFRQGDTLEVADGLRDGLVARLPRATIATEIESVPPGADVQLFVEDEFTRRDTVLVLIGNGWTDSASPDGLTYLDQPLDAARMGIAAALRGVPRVIPVLIDGVAMPTRVELPPDLGDLTRLQAARLDGGRRRADIDALAQLILTAPPTASSVTRPILRPSRGRVVGRSAAAAVGLAALFAAGLGAGRAMSPQETEAAAPTTGPTLPSLESVSAKVSAPAFKGTPAALHAKPKPKPKPRVAASGGGPAPVTPTATTTPVTPTPNPVTPSGGGTGGGAGGGGGGGEEVVVG